MGIGSIAWMLIILLFGGLGFFLDKFKKGMFWGLLAVGVFCAVIAVNMLD